MSLPLIVTGMHRSGTSLVASFIQAIGVDLGDNLLEGDSFNVKGYFEDVDFLEFQRSVLQACCRPGEGGWPDWGWTESECLDRSKFQNYTQAARELIATRSDRSMSWGWKDPRTSLMLDFWHQLLPQARYLFVYRRPWDVVDSILRGNSGIFSQRPDYALRSWAFYNRNLLSFYRKNPGCCILFNVNAFLQQPSRLVEIVENKLGLQVKNNWQERKFKEIYDERLFNTLDEGAAVVRLLKNITPQYMVLLEELDRAADIPSNFSEKPISWEVPPPLESLALLLHYQTLESQKQLKSLSIQGDRDKLELQEEVDRLRQEISDIKMSKAWQVKEKLEQMRDLLRQKGLGN